MTDVDRMTGLTGDESRLRAELARTLVPPPTPASLRMSVDAMAAEHLAAPKGADRRWIGTLGIGGRGVRFAAGTTAVVTLAVVGLVLLQGRGEGDVAATPVPTLPAVTQPALPDPSGTGRITTGAGWIDEDTAWATTGDSTDLWTTADGGQTWEEVGSVPNSAAPVFVDRSSAYAAYAVPSTASGHAFGVYRTVDGGRTWLPFQAGVVPATEGSSPIVEAHFTDPDHGVVLGTSLGPDSVPASPGPALVCRGWSTDDGGERWTSIEDGPCILGGRWGTATLGAMYTTALGGSVALTVDGGRTWIEGRIPGVADGDRFATAALVPLADGGARLLVHRPPVGDIGAWMLVALDTRDGGATWQETWAVPEAPLLTHVTALTADHLVALGEGNTIPGNLSTFDSWDGGRTWTKTTNSLLVDGGMGAAWLDRLHGTVRAGWMDCRDRTKDCSASASTMWLTNDGGRTWHEVPF